MANTDFSTIKETFTQCLYKIALQKIKYITPESLKILVDYVSDEFIHTYTLLEFASFTPFDVSVEEYNKHIKRHSKKILANHYDCSSYLNINNSYIHLEHFSNAMHILYQYASSIDLQTLI
jgi:hypothetical protein